MLLDILVPNLLTVPSLANFLFIILDSSHRSCRDICYVSQLMGVNGGSI